MELRGDEGEKSGWSLGSKRNRLRSAHLEVLQKLELEWKLCGSNILGLSWTFYDPFFPSPAVPSTESSIKGTSSPTNWLKRTQRPIRLFDTSRANVVVSSLGKDGPCCCFVHLGHCNLDVKRNEVHGKKGINGSRHFIETYYTRTRGPGDVLVVSLWLMFVGALELCPFWGLGSWRCPCKDGNKCCGWTSDSVSQTSEVNFEHQTSWI